MQPLASRRTGPAAGAEFFFVASGPGPSGGVYSGENAASDFQVPWPKNMLGFLGMTKVEIIRVEGTAYGPEAAGKALECATAQARDLVGALAVA
jgi:FMN-dependent NADH-azoreductase